MPPPTQLQQPIPLHSTLHSTLHLTLHAREQLEAHARAAYPREACGLLLGAQIDGDETVHLASRGQNLELDRPESRFLLDPGHVVHCETLAGIAGLRVLGVWHSHPDRPAFPSRADLEAAWDGWHQLIVSVCLGEVAEARAWATDDGAAQELALQGATPPTTSPG